MSEPTSAAIPAYSNCVGEFAKAFTSLTYFPNELFCRLYPNAVEIFIPI